MKKYIAVVLSVLFMLWIGFVTRDKPEQTHEVLNTEFDNSSDLKTTDMNLYIVDDNYKLSMYEPYDGCYLGAYVLNNSALNYDIAEFERVLNKRHSIYIYNLELGNSFPTDWILECIANMKTPLVIIHPKDDMILNETFLYDTAKSCSQLAVPIFIDFYPEPQKYNIFPDEYRQFYIKARDVFKKYSSNASFVWTANIENVYDSNIYYPGNDYVDWVGLNIYQPIYKNGVKFESDIWSKFDFFYNNYQKLKPIMITQFAVSHYSDVDHTYYIEEAKTKIKDFYTKIRTEYPRVKGINYMDFKSNEDYKITDDSSISKLYKTLTDCEYFKYSVDLKNTNYNSELFKTAFPVCSDGERFYISSKVFEYELDIDISSNDGISFMDTQWYPIDTLKKYRNCNIEIDGNNIYIKNLILK